MSKKSTIKPGDKKDYFNNGKPSPSPSRKNESTVTSNLPYPPVKKDKGGDDKKDDSKDN